MISRVHIFELGGNVSSVVNAFHQLNVDCTVIRHSNDVLQASHLILPGIGHFSNAMTRLEELDLVGATKVHIQNQKPFLGICLGMQLLASFSEESQSNGLSIFNATIKEMLVSNSEQFKIPHSGWNTLKFKQNSPLFNGLSENDEFFFLHKYHWSGHENNTFATTEYEHEFPSVIGSNNCWGVQFHPEKSHDSGLRLLENFLKL